MLPHSYNHFHKDSRSSRLLYRWGEGRFARMFGMRTKREAPQRLDGSFSDAPKDPVAESDLEQKFFDSGHDQEHLKLVEADAPYAHEKMMAGAFTPKAETPSDPYMGENATEKAWFESGNDENHLARTDVDPQDGLQNVRDAAQQAKASAKPKFLSRDRMREVAEETAEAQREKALPPPIPPAVFQESPQPISLSETQEDLPFYLDDEGDDDMFTSATTDHTQKEDLPFRMEAKNENNDDEDVVTSATTDYTSEKKKMPPVPPQMHTPESDAIRKQEILQANDGIEPAEGTSDYTEFKQILRREDNEKRLAAPPRETVHELLADIRADIAAQPDVQAQQAGVDAYAQKVGQENLVKMARGFAKQKTEGPLRTELDTLKTEYPEVGNLFERTINGQTFTRGQEVVYTDRKGNRAIMKVDLPPGLAAGSLALKGTIINKRGREQNLSFAIGSDAVAKRIDTDVAGFRKQFEGAQGRVPAHVRAIRKIPGLRRLLGRQKTEPVQAHIEAVTPPPEGTQRAA